MGQFAAEVAFCIPLNPSMPLQEPKRCQTEKLIQKLKYRQYVTFYIKNYLISVAIFLSKSSANYTDIYILKKRF